MGIPVPSSTPITIAAVESNSEYFQTFTFADSTGALIDYANPIPVNVSLSGYSSISASYQGTVVPIGGVYINDLTGGDFTEMVDGEMGTIRLNNRRAIMAASDGQVTVLNSSQTTNYHDVVVSSGSFNGTVVAAYSAFFNYSSNNTAKQVYIPLSRSGFRRVSVFFKHTLTNDTDATGHALPISVFGDFGQFDVDFELYSGTLSGIAGQDATRAFVCYNPTISGTAFTYIPALDSPLAGIFIAISPTQPVTGSFEIYASKGA